ncbi:MAG: DNA methyltransferase, partial [Thermoanaerobaculia bacterium]
TTIPEPVLRDYDNIECRDAVLTWDGDPELARDEHGVPITRWDGTTMKKSAVTGEPVPDDSARIPVYTYKNPRPAEWPKADFIIGNPPYIGKLLLRKSMGDGYTEALRQAYEGAVPDGSDFVMYWWFAAAQLVSERRVRRAGLISTNTIWQTTNRRVVAQQMSAESPVSLAFAIPDHPWVDSADGAAVRVALSVVAPGPAVGMLRKVEHEVFVGSEEVGVELSERRGYIGPDFRVGADLTSVETLRANRELSGTGLILGSRGFVLERDEALGIAARGDAYAALLFPLRNGSDITDRSRDFYVIDTGSCEEQYLREKAPALYQRLLERVRPEREQNRDPRLRARWWLHRRSSEQVRAAIAGLERYIATSETAKHRVFVFLKGGVRPEHKLVVVGSSDALLLAILSSRLHATWALGTGGRLGVGNDSVYSKTRCFDPFPFPVCAFEVGERIRGLGEQLDGHRKRQQAAHPGLTITGMYNVLEKLRSGEALSAKERVIHEQGLVSVLKQIHDDLDAAVFEAYGWPGSLTDEEILERLVALNHERAEEEKRGLIRWLRPEFQNPQGTQDATQAELPGTAAKADKVAKGAKAAKAGKAEKRAWPKDLPQQVAEVRDLLGEIGRLDLASAKAAFKGAKDEALVASLDSLAALGLAVAVGAGEERSWSAVS